MSRFKCLVPVSEVQNNYLSRALKSKGPRRSRQFLLLSEVEPEPDDGRVRHDRRRNRTNRLRRREEPAPRLHQRQNGLKAELRCTRHQPPNHLSATPVERRKRHSHYLKSELEGDVDQGRDSESVLRHSVPERVLGEFEEVRRTVDVTLRRFKNGPKFGDVAWKKLSHLNLCQ